jgi:hypothetical protein
MLMDRVIARRIGCDPGIVDRARAALKEDIARVENPEWWAAEWLSILDLPLSDIRRFVTSRSPHARRLSDCSPFCDSDVVGFDISDVDWRKRVLRKAHAGVERPVPSFSANR